MAKKTNPRRIPRTQDDVRKAMLEGHSDGAKFMSKLMLFILQDKHEFPREKIRALADDVSFYCDQINKKELKWTDIEFALKDEYDITVRF